MKRLALALVALGVLAVFAAPAMAAYVEVNPGDDLKFWASAYGGSVQDGKHLYGVSNGGEFQFQVFNGTSGASLGYIITFCAERTQFIGYNETYNVDAVVNAKDSPTPGLSDFGAWVFWGYNTALERNNVVPDRTGSLNAMDTDVKGATVQYALWKELKAGVPSGWDGDYSATVYGDTPEDPDDGGWQQKWHEDTTWSALRDAGKVTTYVAVLDSNQNQFVFVPRELSTPPIPEPASMAIWAVGGGLAAAGVALKRRRRRWSDENRQAITELVTSRARRG